MRILVQGTMIGSLVLAAACFSPQASFASKHQPPPTATPTPKPTSTPTPVGTPPPSSGYSGTTAASYADTYWSTYNSAYPTCANQGGDCTNFVSQALHAGGITMRMSPPYSGNAAWYIMSNGGQWSYSTPWVNAQDNSIFALQSLPGVTQVASYIGIAPGQTVATHAVQGDVVLYDWNNDGIYDHEAVISTADGQSVDAHTSNRYHQYWTLAQYNTQWSTTRVTVLHISAGTH
ncbi:MAG: hypothetical protein NVS2B16_14580 [Chloroflexota bacterium]